MSNRKLLIASLSLFLILSTATAQEQDNLQVIPQFDLIRTAPVDLPGDVDSNSPAFWRFEHGLDWLTVVTSVGNPSVSLGPSIRGMGPARPARFWTEANGGRWMEAILQDAQGTLYGYYHNEPNGLCGRTGKTAPRIGAARSLDHGLSWQDLGVILEVPVTRLDCATPNEYFAGGVGDFSVVLDPQQTDAYFFFSIYTGSTTKQGVVVGRMPWAQRDTPRGNLAVWDGQVWDSAPGSGWQIRRNFFEPDPIYAAELSWHHRSGSVDAFWGPSVHWNTFLNQYVMLLNRASDSAWTQEGIYISFSPSLDDPTQWTKPIKIFEGGGWYPQVLGLERERGTDKLAGAVSRLFVGGRSDYFLVFRSRGR